MMSLANQLASRIEETPHHGDARAASLMKQVLAQFKTKTEEALRLVQSNEGSDALSLLVDDAIPSVEVWIARCEEEGEV